MGNNMNENEALAQFVAEGSRVARDMFGLFGDDDTEFTRTQARESAIIATSYIDYLLQSLLQHAFIKSSNTVDRIFSTSGLLATTDAKATLCYALGIISKEEYRSVKFVEEIRNKLAHSFARLTFASDELAKVFEGFVYPELPPFSYTVTDPETGKVATMGGDHTAEERSAFYEEMRKLREPEERWTVFHCLTVDLLRCLSYRVVQNMSED